MTLLPLRAIAREKFISVRIVRDTAARYGIGMFRQPLGFIRRETGSVQASDHEELIIGRGATHHLQLRQQQVSLCWRHVSESRTLNGLTLVSQNATLARNGLRGVDVVARDHAYSDACALGCGNGLYDVTSEGIDDADDAVHHKVLAVGWSFAPVRRQLSHAREVSVGQAERAKGLVRHMLNVGVDVVALRLVEGHRRAAAIGEVSAVFHHPLRGALAKHTNFAVRQSHDTGRTLLGAVEGEDLVSGRIEHGILERLLICTPRLGHHHQSALRLVANHLRLGQRLAVITLIYENGSAVNTRLCTNEIPEGCRHCVCVDR